MIPIIVLGLTQLFLIFIPYLLLNQPLKRISGISFIIILILLLPPLFLGQIYLDTTDNIFEWKDLITLSFNLSLATIALLPMAFKSTVLLWRHEVRLYEFNRNILIFLAVTLGETFVRLFHGIQKYMIIINSY